MNINIKELLIPLDEDTIYLDLFENFGKENNTLKKEDYLDVYELVDTVKVINNYLEDILKKLTETHKTFYLKYLDLEDNDKDLVYTKYKYATSDINFKYVNKNEPKYSFKPYYFKKDGLVAKYLYKYFKTNEAGLNKMHPFLYLDGDHFIFIDTSLYVDNNKLNIKNTLTLSTEDKKEQIDISEKEVIKENIKNINEIINLEILNPYKEHLKYCLLDTLYKNPKRPLSNLLQSMKITYIINDLKEKESIITEEIEEKFNKLFIYKVTNKHQINKYLKELNQKDTEIIESNTDKTIIISKKALVL